MEGLRQSGSSSSCSSRLYKILVVGEVHTGKSAIIRRYVHNFFNENYRSTVGVDFHVKIISLGDDCDIRLQLWDIAGQERFSQMTRAYYKGAHGAMIVFDLSSSSSFEAVSRWKRDLDTKCHLPDGRRIPTVLVANKCDLERNRVIPDDFGIAEVANDLGMVPKWFKTSALTGQGVDEALRLLVRYILAVDSWNGPSLTYDDDFPRNTIKVEDDEKARGKAKKANCC